MRPKIVACALSLMFGCGHELPHLRTDDQSIQADQIRNIELLTPGITVPDDWILDDTQQNIFKNLTTVFIAQSPDKISGKKVTVSINMQPWDDGPELFAAASVKNMQDSDWPITRALPIWVNTIPASRVDATWNGNIIFQVNVAISGIAYTVLCTGAQSETAQSLCHSILASLELVPAASLLEIR